METAAANIQRIKKKNRTWQLEEQQESERSTEARGGGQNQSTGGLFLEPGPSLPSTRKQGASDRRSSNTDVEKKTNENAKA